MTTRTRARRTVAIITGTRAEYGLLRPIMIAVQKNKKLKLQVIAAGAHFLAPARTIHEVEAEFTIAARVPMQISGKLGRDADAAALGRGISGFASTFANMKPDCVVVLGDRIEAFAAASAASIAGIAVCHIHGGDRAEGIADEAMRHAITKLAHLHCAATKLSAERIIKMGEKPEHVHVTGSPAIDGLRDIKPMSNREAAKFGDPRVVVILHPWGATARQTRSVVNDMARMLQLFCADESGSHILWLLPNHDAGHNDIMDPLRKHGLGHSQLRPHLPRSTLIALFKRLALQSPRGVLAGNSSAGLIEAAALGLPVVNVGSRQAGRERSANVIDVPLPSSGEFIEAFGFALEKAGSFNPKPATTFGDGRACSRIASLLALTDPHAPALLRKHNTY